MSTLTRIKFRNTDTTGEYSLAYNPDTFDPIDSANMTLINILDGTPARITGSFDNRVRTMSWPAYPVSNTVFMTMVNTIKGYKGLEKQINLGDVDSPYSYGWRNIKITDVRTSLLSGGNLRLGMELDYVYTSSY